LTSRICSDSLRDLTLPIASFTTGRRFSSAISQQVGNRRIEDLPIPFFCVSANLNSMEVKAHSEGPLARAILASTRAPGAFPPLVIDGEMHVDGGLFDNIPLGIMKEFINGGHVIGVDVSSPHTGGLVPDYGLHLSGIRALRNLFRPPSKRQNLPNLLQILVRSTEFGGIANRQLAVGLADLYLRPPLDSFSRFDFNRGEEMAAVAYAWSRPRIERWLSLASSPVGR